MNDFLRFINIVTIPSAFCDQLFFFVLIACYIKEKPYLCIHDEKSCCFRNVMHDTATIQFMQPERQGGIK